MAHAIDGLFATGRFDDIVVEAEPAGEGVIVRFVTQTARFLGGITVEGKVVESPNRAQVDSATQLTLGAPFQDDDVMPKQWIASIACFRPTDSMRRT